LNVPLDNSGSGIAVFRTTWKSSVIPVSATYESFVAGAQVKVNPPYRFFLLVFVGGLLGAIASKKKIAWRLIGPGVLGGVVAAVLSVTGVLKLFGASGGYLPIVAFVVAVIGGWGGDRTLNWVWDWLFPEGKETVDK
jgi:peptidoglycan/LPS O-acetylase OafA/YrhL